ncbi:MAG: hypothetical protein ABIS66_07705 [Sphingomicrobium sp.]
MRNGLAGVLVAAVPATASFAATRPNAAVPVAGSTAVAAQYNNDDRQAGISWVALAAIGLAIGVALFLILDKDDKGEGSLSQG